MLGWSEKTTRLRGKSDFHFDASSQFVEGVLRYPRNLRTPHKRVSYIGQGTRDLVYAPNLNQSANSTTFYAEQPLSARRYPNWGEVNDRAVGGERAEIAG